MVLVRPACLQSGHDLSHDLCLRVDLGRGLVRKPAG